MKGYLRVATLMPEIKVGGVKNNLQSIKKLLTEANEIGSKICVFPNLVLTGNNLQSLYADKNILNECLNAIFDIIYSFKDIDSIIVVSCPFKYKGNIYDVAFIIKSGDILGMVPKVKYSDDEVDRDYFKSGYNIDTNIEFFDEDRKIKYDCYFSSNLTFENERFDFSITFNENFDNICSASMYLDLSNIQETVFIDDKIKGIKDRSKILKAAIVTCSSGPSESSCSNSYFGRSMICEDGCIIKNNEDIMNKILIADIDLDVVENYRNENSRKANIVRYDFNFNQDYPTYRKLYRDFDMFPFIDKSIEPYKYGIHIIHMQAVALAKRLKSIGVKNIVIGLSGGVDSTLALLVSKATMKYLSLSESNIFAYSMPGFGTTSATNNNAKDLAKALDIDLKEINISESVTLHFKNINHDINIINNTFENAQARERTQILLDVANDVNGMLVGTDDLSENALGFSTFGGDQLSMYNVNGSLPKTLIKYILNSIAVENIDKNNNLSKTLKNILSTPISPELLPTNNGVLLQKTEEILGNYEIHDCILYYYLKYNFDSEKIYDLLLHTFVYDDKHPYSDDYIKKCVEVFFKRFYVSSYKRTTSSDYPDIGLPNLNSNLGFKMPNDTEI